MQKFRIFAPWCIAMLAIGACVYMYVSPIKERTTDSEITVLVKAIGAVMELPQSETPTLATVTDIAKLPAIPFFSKAKLADKVLIYQQSAKAILYRPSTKKIIEVSAFNAPTSTTSQVVQEKKDVFTVELRNGTGKVALTQDYEKSLYGKIPTARVVAKTSAKSKDYKDTMVIAQQNSTENDVTAIAKTLDAAVSTLPLLESTSSANILIIVGADALQ